MPRDDDMAGGWAWFEAHAAAGAEDTGEAPDLAAVAARCFRGRDGLRLLGHLRRMTVERTLAPDIGEPQLRHLEGQRFLLRYLEALIETGIAGPRGVTELNREEP